MSILKKFTNIVTVSIKSFLTFQGNTRIDQNLDLLLEISGDTV